jgi:hypothetical protein
MTIGAQTAIPSRGNERLCFASNSSFRSGEPFQFMNRPQCLAEAQNLRLTKEAPAYVVSYYYAVVAPGGIIGHGKTGGYDITNFIFETSRLFTEIVFLDILEYGIRAEYIEVLISRKFRCKNSQESPRLSLHQ